MKWRQNRFGRVGVCLLAVLVLSACGSGSSGTPEEDLGTQDSQQQDLARADATEDAVHETVGEVADAVPGETADDVADQDISPDAVEEILPMLPPDKEFSTRYVAGAASRDITPTEPMFLGGFGFCAGKLSACRVSEGVHDPIEVNVVALGDTVTEEVVFFIAVDSTGFIKHDIDLVHQAAPAAFKERFGVRMDGPRLMVGASHSHSAPDTCGIWAPMEGEERDAEAYISHVRDEILQAALDAYGNLEDANLTWGLGSAPNHSDDLDADDEDVFAVKGTRLDDSVMFVLTRWNAHPTCYGSENNGLSADYLGPFRKRMKEQVGGVQVFMNGPIGSVYTSPPTDCFEPDAFPEGWQDPDNSAERHSKNACVGYNVANEVMKGLEQEQPLAETGIKFRHHEFEFHPTNYVLMLALASWPVPIQVVDTQDPDAMMTSQFSWATIGNLVWITTPGESFPSFAQGIKDAMMKKGITTPVVMGLTQDWMGYLMTYEQWKAPGSTLNYFKSLSPGELVFEGYIKVLQQVLDSEFGSD